MASPDGSFSGADAAHDDSAPQRRSARAGKGRKRPASSLEEDIDFALDEGEDLDEEPTSRLRQLVIMPAAIGLPAPSIDCFLEDEVDQEDNISNSETLFWQVSLVA